MTNPLVRKIIHQIFCFIRKVAEKEDIPFVEDNIHVDWNAGVQRWQIIFVKRRGSTDVIIRVDLGPVFPSVDEVLKEKLRAAFYKINGPIPENIPSVFGD